MTAYTAIPVSHTAIYLQQLMTQSESTRWDNFLDPTNQAYLPPLFDTDKQIADRDEAIRQQHDERISLLAKRQHLQELYAQIRVQDGKRSQFEADLTAGLQRITNFNEVNASLV